MQNVKPLATSWPVPTRKQQYIISSEASAYILLPNRNYVLLRRFSAKEEHRRLTAAPYLSLDRQFTQFNLVGLENHLNYIYRPDGELTPEEAYGISTILNCKLLDTYFRSFNGNTQVSATELRSIPLPQLETIREIGREAATGKRTNGELDEWISDMLMQSPHERMEEISGKDRRRAGHFAGTRPASRPAKRNIRIHATGSL
jgi:adenine-specific DNA-methyltransferase